MKIFSGSIRTVALSATLGGIIGASPFLGWVYFSDTAETPDEYSFLFLFWCFFLLLALELMLTYFLPIQDQLRGGTDAEDI